MESTAAMDVSRQHIRASEEEIQRIRSTHKHKGGGGRPWTFWVGRVLFYILVLFIIIYTLFPFYWAIVSSLKTSGTVTQTDLWPKEATLDNYRTVFQNSSFRKALLNSTIVSTTVVLISLFLGIVAAYAIARLPFRGRKFTLYLILSMTMFPSVAIIGSLFQMMKTFHAFNTLWGLIIVYLTFTLPFTIWVLSNFFKSMPADLEEAALVDGATPMGALWKILLPLAVPGAVTTGLLAFINAWSEFLYARSFTLTEKALTVQVAISQFTGNQQYELPFAVRMAAAVVVTVPLLVGVLLVQGRIIAGLSAGAVKG